MLVEHSLRANGRQGSSPVHRRPNLPLNPDAASSSHRPRQPFGFLFSIFPRRFGSAG